METRDEIIKLNVARLKSIKNLDEYKEAHDDIIDLAERYFHSIEDGLNACLDDKNPMSPEKKAAEAAKFNDGDYIAPPEIGKEMARIDSLPGVEEYSASLNDEMIKRLGPIMEEIQKKLGLVMDSLLDTMVEPVKEVMDDMGKAMSDVGESFMPQMEEEEFESAYEPNNPDTPAMLYELYFSKTLEDLKKNKDSLITTLQNELEYDIGFLETLNRLDLELYMEDDWERVAKIKNKWWRYEGELNKEFVRLSSLPNAFKPAYLIKKEITDKINSKFPTMNMYMRNVKKKPKAEKS